MRTPTFKNYKIVKHGTRKGTHSHRALSYQWVVFKHVDGRSTLYIGSFDTQRDAIRCASNHQGITDGLSYDRRKE